MTRNFAQTADFFAQQRERERESERERERARASHIPAPPSFLQFGQSNAVQQDRTMKCMKLKIIIFALIVRSVIITINAKNNSNNAHLVKTTLT